MIAPIIETTRITLRPLRVADAGTIYSNWGSDPDVSKYMRWTTHQSVGDTLEWLTAEEEKAGKENHYSWGFVLRENGELFGSGSIMYDGERGIPELGYCIMKKYWNQGLTTEAAGAIVRFAACDLGVRAMFAVHAKENPASGRVLEKLGFVCQGDGTVTSFDKTRVFATREYLISFSRRHN